jgi:uncharacterized protein (DUF433 family)
MPMGFPATTDANVIPLRESEGGVVRVGQTRVTLDSVIWAFRNGATAEEIAQRYPSLELADVYSVITYYLHQTDEVDTYLAQQQAEAASVRAQYESRFDPTGIRARLLARRGPHGP